MSEVCRYILIDYDNLRKNVHTSESKIWTDVRYSVRRLAKSTSFWEDVPNLARVSVRLYGGWSDCQGRRTQEASKLIAEFGSSQIQMYQLDENRKMLLDLQLADGLLSLSGTQFEATFRRNAIDGLRINPSASFCGCKHGSIVQSYLKQYFRTGICSACKKPIGDVFEHEGQKMVDSMIFCDAYYAVNKVRASVAVVSSDDDMVPILFQLASEAPTRVVRIQTTTPGMAYQTYYSKIKPDGLTEVAW